MSCFKRAEWSSGLTYQQVCRSCGNIMTYRDDILDFRPWYPDGFVYCTKCKNPLRHSERFAVNAPGASAQNRPANSRAVDSGAASSLALFCTQCGAKFSEGARFCAMCGAKRG